MRSGVKALTPEQQAAVDKLEQLVANAEAEAAKTGGSSPSAELGRVMQQLFVTKLTASLREQLAEHQQAERQQAASAAPEGGQRGTLDEQVLHLCAQAEQAGAQPAAVVDALCWALAMYGATRSMNADVVQRTLAQVQRITRTKVLA